ncbi:MAG: hypothetical protein ACR2I0_07460, partial [Rhodoferax sp.]
MKNFAWTLPLAAALLLPACALEQYTEVCNKYPTNDARQDCEQRQRALFKALSQQQEAQKQEAQKMQKAPEEAPPKPNGLCFRREATGELVCP